ncbi:hypothetical protein CDHC04_2143 [Corynebacterium diphtheriae HC04]|nr:hypothetical protein CDHC04_2143 [Corynebacterium diphtheriae HC04]
MQPLLGSRVRAVELSSRLFTPELLTLNALTAFAL